jgi:tetratricopeptide (TPR) repeat protein
MIGNVVGRKRVLTHALRLWRERDDEYEVANTLRELSGANRILGLHEEGIEHVREAMEIFNRLGKTGEQARSMARLAALLHEDKQLDAAEDAATHAIKILPARGRECSACECHRRLGDICRSKGKRVEAIHHYEAALGIASPLNWNDQLFWIHVSLARLFLEENEFDDAHAHVKKAKLHTANNAHHRGHAMELHARVWFRECKIGEAKSEALRALETFETLGLVRCVGRCRELLQSIERGVEGRFTSS